MRVCKSHRNDTCLPTGTALGEEDDESNGGGRGRGRQRKEEREKKMEKRVVVHEIEDLYRQTRRGRYRISLLRTQLATRDWLGVEVR